jgi:hypothetical protein
VLGYSDYSDISYILAATNPAKPQVKPLLVSVDASQITISLTNIGKTNGDPITHFILNMQAGFDSQPT